jgi:hypothetical protein
MKQESAIIFGVSALLTAAIIGGVYYMAVVKNAAEPPDPANATWQTLKPSDSQPTGNASISAVTSSARTSTPIKCHDPEIGEFWTNAASCGEADLHNRISDAQSVTTAEERRAYGHEDYVSPQEEAERNRGKTSNLNQSAAKKPSLPLAGKSPPSNLNAICTFAVGKALEIERALSAADDPAESKWKDDYCKWRREAREENCQVPSDTYYYENLCGYGW